MKILAYIREWVIIILIAAAIAITLTIFVFDTRIVPTGSMRTTIIENDRMINYKLAYISSPPQRGDIIVFEPPPELNESDDLLKRIIGLPGETVEIKNGGVYINDELLDEPYLQSKPTYTFAKIGIPEGYYFVLGDNRNSSFDSHAWLNPYVPAENIKGKIVFRYWPLSRFGTVQ